MPSRSMRASRSTSQDKYSRIAWVVSFDRGPVWQIVGSGERLGVRVPHYNLVRNIDQLGQWTGEPVAFDRVRCLWDCVVLVQAPRGGPILAAARASVRGPG